MRDEKNMREYHQTLRQATDNSFQRQALDRFARAYPESRRNAFSGKDIRECISHVADCKDAALPHLMDLFGQFKEKAEAAGVHVHLAKNAAEANDIIRGIAAKNEVRRIVKSKSMTAEEIGLNHALEKDGLEVIETDLGEWIVQLRKEGPSHMVLPAIHLSRHQVSDLLTAATGEQQSEEVAKLVKVARRELRNAFLTADMGITGANFCVASTGTIGLVTNEGNARLVTTMPRVHVALAGVDKLVPRLRDALSILEVLPKNATGQNITSYVTWIGGTPENSGAQDGKQERHIVFLDNGRLSMANDPDFAEVLRCVRCGACANVCPIYRVTGGHAYGHVYIGAIGLILTYFLHGRDKAQNLLRNCVNCQACKDICAAYIDLPRIIKKVHARMNEEQGRTLPDTLLGAVMRDRKLFHGMLRTAKLLSKPLTSKGYVRHLPEVLLKENGFRALPALADKPFRDIFFTTVRNPAKPKRKIALFAGCAGDFIYPEQLEAALKVFETTDIEVDFPMKQSCCGLPLMMNGEPHAARDLMVHNMRAFNNEDYDAIVTLCASCASFLKHDYTKLLGTTAGKFADKIMDFSSFVREMTDLKSSDFPAEGEDVTYHAPCHLCRGLDVHSQPRELIRLSGCAYLPAEEEEVCCGFGGSYSAKFPEVSREILQTKLDSLEKTKAVRVVTDCPGCVLQIRGGMKKRNSPQKVSHIAELLAEQLEKK